MKSLPSRPDRILAVLVCLCSALFVFIACKKNPPSPPVTPAKGSLLQEGGGCYPYAVHGQYYNGVAGADTDFVEVRVDVTTPGTYKIITDTVMGVSFSASGMFSDTGVNLVHLRSTGAFSEHTLADFHTSFDSTHCIFRIGIQDSAGLSIADNTWEFDAAGKHYEGPGFAVSTLYPGGDDSFIWYGSMAGFSDTSLVINYLISVYDPTACSHPTSSDGSVFHYISSRFATGPQVRFDATPTSIPAVIDVYNCSSNVYYFNGTARDSANNIVPITNARLKATNIRQEYLH